MRTLRALGVVTALLASPGAIAAAPLTGGVLDAVGDPAVGARVEVYAPEDQRSERRRILAGRSRAALVIGATGPDGRFDLEVPDASGPRIVEVVVRADGAAPWTGAALAGTDVGLVGLVAAPTSRRRVLLQGRPLAGATVVVTAADGRAAVVARTDADGVWEAPEPAAWAGAVVVLHPEAAPRVVALRSEMGPYHHLRSAPTAVALPADLELERGRRLVGRVLAARGAPAGEVEIEVGGWPVTRSDAEGRFDLQVGAGDDADLRIVARRGRSRAEAEPGRPGEDGPELRLAEAGRIRIRVVDSASGTGIVGARILAWAEGGAERLATDGDGRAVLAGWRSGSTILWAEVPGYVLEAGGFHRVALASTSDETVTFRGTREHRLAGRVVDADGRPAPGITVGWLPAGMPLAYRRPDPGVLTDAAGRFSLADPQEWEAGSLRLVAVGPGRPPGLADLPDPALGREIEIRLPRGIELPITVRDRDGGPVAGATVALVEGALSGPLSWMLTDESGWLHRTDRAGDLAAVVRPGRHLVAVRAAGFAPEVRTGVEVREGSDPAPLELVLRPGAVLAGRVLDDRDEPVEGATLELHDGGEVRHWKVSAADGAFRFEDLASGRWILEARAEDALPAAPVAVETPFDDLVVRLDRGERLTGRVVDAATLRPIGGAVVRAAGVGRTSGRGGILRSAVTVEDGTFSLAGLLPGRVRLDGAAEGYVRRDGPELEIAPGEVAEVELALDRGAVQRGTVVDDRGEPVVDAVVGASTRRDPGGRAEALPAVATDGGGRFELAGLPAGRLEVSVRSDEHLPAIRTVELEPGSEAPELRIELEAGGRIRGIVRDGDGQPVGGAFVSVESPEAGFESRYGTTEGDGRFDLGGLGAGPLTLAVRSAGFRDARLPGLDPAAGRPVEIELERLPTGVIVGAIAGAEPDHYLSVSVSGGGPTVSGEVAADGSYRIEEAPAGDVAVRLDVAGMSEQRALVRRAVLPADGEVRVDFELDRAVEVSGRVVRDAAPVLGADLHFGSPDASGSASTTTDAEGRYRLELETGPWRVDVADPGGVSVRREVRIDSPTILDFDLTGSRLVGRVTDAATGEGLGGARVELLPTRRADGDASGGLPELEADADGRFTFDRAPTGPLLVRAGHPGYARRLVEVGLESGRETSLEIPLEPTAGLRVVLRDARTGAALEGSIVARDARDAVIHDGAAPREGEGVRLPLGPGTYRISVSAAGYASRTVAAGVPSDELVVPLTPGGTIRVLSATLARRTAKLIAPDGEEYVRCWCNRLAAFRVEGSETRIEHVEPGPYAFVVIESDGSTATYPLEVFEGGVTEVSIR